MQVLFFAFATLSKFLSLYFTHIITNVSFGASDGGVNVCRRSDDGNYKYFAVQTDFYIHTLLRIKEKWCNWSGRTRFMVFQEIYYEYIKHAIS